MTDPHLQLKIGMPVEATDGPLGHIHQIILSPAQRRVVGLAVRTGLLPPRDVLVPVELIVDATEERVKLRVDCDDIRRQPAFNPAHYLALPAEEQSDKLDTALVSIYGGAGGAQDQALVAAHQREETKTAQEGVFAGSTVALQRSQPVWAMDGRVGRVDLLLLDPNGQVRHFVIRKGGLLGYDVLVPVDWISAIDKHGVWLTLARTALDRLPPYLPDSTIAANVIEVLWQNEAIRTSDIEAIDVTVRDGVVILRGYICSRFNKAQAVREVRQVPGVRDVDNQLVVDPEVEVAVAQALAQDPRTGGQPIAVYVKHGVVTLSGKLNSAAVRAAVEEVTASVPQTRAIVNDIQTPGVVVDPAQQRVLQPRIGQHVYARDMELGRVETVIINPHHRRVTAVVVNGKFPARSHSAAHTLSDDMAQEERWVVIPIEVIRHVGIGGVMLTINGDATSHYPDFDPNHFRAPPTRWQPPYPYTHADVLLEPTEMPVLAVAEQATRDSPNLQ